jgi:hypothetical protein
METREEDMMLKKLAHLSASLLGALLFAPVLAAAQPAGPSLSEAEIKTIAPLLRRYDTLVLLETKPDGNLRDMTLAIRVAAPREVVFSVFENPADFYYISTLFKENEVRDSHDNTKAWTWASRHSLFSFTGLNTIALFPPRRADVTITQSNIGSGGFKLFFFEEDKKHTLLLINGLLDVNSSEWLVKFLVGTSPSMRQAMNAAIGLIMIKGIKDVAEQKAAGKPLAKHTVKGSRKGELKPLSSEDIASVSGLIERGTVVLARSIKGGRLEQATVIEKTRAPLAKVLAAVATPEFYPKMIRAIDEVVVHERTPGKVDFSWKIGLSVLSLQSRNTLEFKEDGVTVSASGGELDGASWRWQLRDMGSDTTMVAYHGWADMDKTGAVLGKSCKREPYLEHGFMAGSNMVMVNAIRRVVELPPSP